MASASASAICEICDCAYPSSVLCEHCQKQICHRHFNELHPLTDELNELNEKLSQIRLQDLQKRSIIELQEWRNQSIQMINQMYEIKVQEINEAAKNTRIQKEKEHYLKLIDQIKRQAYGFVQENDKNHEQMQAIKQTLKELKEKVQELLDEDNYISLDIEPLNLDYDSICICAKVDHIISRRKKQKINYFDDNAGNLLSIDHQIKLNEFYGNVRQKWRLLYKATRDGYHPQYCFHHRCDNKGPTMTIMQSDNLSLFGGYTSVSWELDYSTYGIEVEDPTAFLFTLTNPHQIPPTKFEIINEESAQQAIRVSYVCGPSFGGSTTSGCCGDYPDSQFSRECSPIAINLNGVYNDPTGLGNLVFTGSHHFIVQEVEVYALEES